MVLSGVCRNYFAGQGLTGHFLIGCLQKYIFSFKRVQFQTNTEKKKDIQNKINKPQQKNDIPSRHTTLKGCCIINTNSLSDSDIFSHFNAVCLLVEICS